MSAKTIAVARGQMSAGQAIRSRPKPMDYMRKTGMIQPTGMRGARF